MIEINEKSYAVVTCNENGDIDASLKIDRIDAESAIGIMTCMASIITSIGEILLGEDVDMVKRDEA